MKRFIFLIFIIFSFHLLLSQEIEERSKDSLSFGRIRILKNIYQPIINHILVKEKIVYDSTFNYQQINYDYFLQYESYQVRNIYLIILDPFEEPINKNSNNIIQRLKKLSGKFHVNTKDSIILNHLLFKKGDQIDAYLFSETERSIRQNQYIFDSGIMIDPDEDSDSQADVFVYVHDLWSIQLTGNYDNSRQKGNLNYKDINFLGYGGSLSLKVKKNSEYTKQYKPDFEYKYSKLFNKYNTGRIFYKSDLKFINYGLGLNQSSIHSTTNYLGGINIDFIKQSIDLINLQENNERNELFYREQDYWVGYNFSITNFNKNYYKYSNLVISSRLIQQFYHRKPAESIAYYQDNAFLLTGLTFINKFYYQDSYIFGFGKTEDIPIGQKFELLYGKEFQKTSNRNYFAISGTHSKYHRHYGYLLNNIRFGTFYLNNAFDYGIFDLQSLYFSHLYFFENYKIRHYFNIRYSKVINPYDQNQLITIKDNIRGYPLYCNLGDKRIIANIEHDLYTPFTVIGFNTAIILFSDFGYIADNNKNLFSSSLKSGVGLGFRFKNERLIIPTIQISFAYYNDSDLYHSNDFKFFTEERTFYQLSRIDFEKPGIYEW